MIHPQSHEVEALETWFFCADLDMSFDSCIRAYQIPRHMGALQSYLEAPKSYVKYPAQARLWKIEIQSSLVIQNKHK